jgi:plasmid maintenance system killer protein
MQIKFNNTYLEILFQGLYVGKPKYSADVIKKFKKTIQVIQFVVSVNDLYNFKGLHFEKLLNGYYSVRVDRKYRLEFLIEKMNLLYKTSSLLKNYLIIMEIIN